VEVEGVTIRFSPPLPHGQDGSEFGHIVAVTVDDGMRFVHASDLQGPASPVATAYLVRERPDLVYVSGAPTYLQGQIGREVVQRGIDNLVRLVGETGCRVILDHHAVREPRFRDRLAQAFNTGRVVTAAEFLGRGDECLEARRAALWARRRRRPAPGREAAAGP
jgi:predicted metallo-beta-lactamase superfamily hydrolase